MFLIHCVLLNFVDFLGNLLYKLKKPFLMIEKGKSRVFNGRVKG
jgi:hypothetical protein